MEKSNDKHQIRIAKKITPDILEVISSSVGIAGKEMVQPILKAITTYGCKNQIAIIQSVSELCPLFSQISDRYFNVLNDAIQISERIDTKNFEIILGAIFADETADIDKKVELAQRITKDVKIQNRENVRMYLKTGVKCVTGVTMIAGVVVIGGLYISYEKVKSINDAKTERTGEIMDGIVNIVKTVNPINSIKECVEIISNNKVKMQENYYKYKSDRYK